MAKLSVVISAYNEEKKIEACLRSVKFADEIVFIDNSSTDDTVKIAKKYTKKVFTQKNDPAKIDLQKNFGIERATGDWILILDGDEEVSEELQKEIQSMINTSGVNGFWIPRKNIIFGKWIQHSGWYPDPQLRLVRKGKGKYTKKHYHEPISVEGETANLLEHLIHYNYETVSQFLIKSLLVYAPNEAEELSRKGYTFDYKDAIRIPVKEFLSRYFSREGYKDGFHGLMLSLLMAMYHFAIFANLWEKNKFIDERFDTASEIEKELHQAGREFAHWSTKIKVQEEKDLLKKFGLKVKGKLRL